MSNNRKVIRINKNKKKKFKKKLAEKIITSLSFTLTKSQVKVCSEIIKDMQKITPMMRLVQGDVGSGKTIVSLIAASMVLG